MQSFDSVINVVLPTAHIYILQFGCKGTNYFFKYTINSEKHSHCVTAPCDLGQLVAEAELPVSIRVSAQSIIGCDYLQLLSATGCWGN